jgi:hypothetical protein
MRAGFGYDPETKQQSSEWKIPNSPTPKNGETGAIKEIVHK